jgi:hypothetical protein
MDKKTRMSTPTVIYRGSRTGEVSVPVGSKDSVSSKMDEAERLWAEMTKGSGDANTDNGK